MQIGHHLSELWKKEKGAFLMKHRVYLQGECFGVYLSACLSVCVVCICLFAPPVLQ